MVLPRAYVPPSRTPELLFDDVFTGIVAGDHPSVGDRSYPIRIVDLPIELPVLEEVLLWHARFDRAPGHAWFRGILKHAAAALPARTQRV